MLTNDLYITIGPKFFSEEINEPIVCSLNELEKGVKYNIEGFIHHLLFHRTPQKNEINLLVHLFRCYTHPVETFAVKVNQNYTKLDTELEDIKPIKLIKKVNGYEISFAPAACDAGGFESRIEKNERGIPHPAPWNFNYFRNYYEWKSAINIYKIDLENECRNN